MTIIVSIAFIYYWLFTIVFETVYLSSVIYRLRKKFKQSPTFKWYTTLINSLKESPQWNYLMQVIFNPATYILGYIGFCIIAPVLFPITIIINIRKILFLESQAKVQNEQLKDIDQTQSKGDDVAKNETQTPFPTGKIITGDGYKLEQGQKFYQVYVKGKNTFSITEETVDAFVMYGSDFYHTRYLHKKNAEQFILDIQQKSYNQLQIKHACVHVGINDIIADKLYLFLEKGAIKC